MLMREHGGLRMPKKQASNYSAIFSPYRYGKVAHNRQMAFRFAKVRGVFTIPFVFSNIINPYRAFAAKGWMKNGRIARHSKLFKSFARCARKGEQCI